MFYRNGVMTHFIGNDLWVIEGDLKHCWLSEWVICQICNHNIVEIETLAIYHKVEKIAFDKLNKRFLWNVCRMDIRCVLHTIEIYVFLLGLASMQNVKTTASKAYVNHNNNDPSFFSHIGHQKHIYYIYVYIYIYIDLCARTWPRSRYIGHG